MTADERPETYRVAAALMRERPGPWEVAYDPPWGNPSDPSTKLCLVAAIQEACCPAADILSGERRYDEDALFRALGAFYEAAGKAAIVFYQEHGASASAGILDDIAARLEAERA